MQPLPSLNRRYTGVPGQNLLAPVLDRPDLQFDDSTPGFNADQQLNVDQSDYSPDPVPPPDPASPTPPSVPADVPANVRAMPSGKPDASNRLKDMAPPPPPPPVENAHPAYSQHIQNLQASDDAAMARDARPPLSNYDKLQALQPPPAPKPPKWYQKLGAVALGAAGGYSQAAGRAPIDPNVIHAGEEGILRPGYARKLATYEQQRDDLTGRVKTDIEQERRDAEAEARGQNAETRRLNMERQAKEDRQRDEDRQKAATEKIQNDKRAAFLKLKGKHDPVYINPGEPVPPGFTQLQDPDNPGKIALIPSGIRKAPKELVDGGYLPGYQANDPVSSEELSKATDAFYKDDREGLKNPNELAMYRDANDPTSPTQKQSQAALAQRDKAKVDTALASRQPREPRAQSAAELNREHQDTVRQLAQRALADSKSGGGATAGTDSYDHAIANLNNPGFYLNDPMDENREEVKALLNKYKMAGLRPEQVQGVINKAAKPKFSQSLGSVTGGGRGAPSTPAAPGRPAAPPAAPTPQRIPVSESVLRQRLQAAGKDVEAGVAAARKNPKFQLNP